MAIKFFTCLLLFTVAFSFTVDLHSYTFNQYAKDFNKIYDNANERMQRKLLFESNLKYILAHNTRPGVSYKMGVNQFTDQTHQELRSLNGYRSDLASLHRLQSNAEIFTAEGLTLPASFDWRDHTPSIITPVKSQGKCGSCWTFASVQTVEAHWALATGRLENLSQQQIVSCTDNSLHCGGVGGCKGGISQLAFQDIINRGGLANEWTYPYTSYQGTEEQCQFDLTLTPPVAKLSSYVSIQENSYRALMEALVYRGPISVNVDASTWHYYEGGVFDGCDTATVDVNHVVQLIGYGTDPEYGDYWTIKNSWGPNWGENGYMRLRRTPQDQLCGIDKQPLDGTGCEGGPLVVTVCGMCGILYDGSFPIIDKSAI